MADERKLKHLEMIQGVINRLAANSLMPRKKRFVSEESIKPTNRSKLAP